MTIFRTIFCGVFCALVSLPAWSAACGPYLASNIANYKSGDVSKWLKYDCVSDNAKWQISGTPLEWAIMGSGVCPGNYNAVKAILEKQPDLANTPTYDKKRTMLSVSIGNCCDADNETKCGANPQDKIAKLLIDNGADVNIVTELSPGNAPRRKRTLLDLVRAQQQYTDTCKRNAGKNTCPAIEQLLIDAGAKTYAELNGETTSSIQAVVHQDTPEVINTTASVPTATKSKTVEIGGTILDYKTGEPVPYANIVLVNPDGSTISNAGCQTDIDGKFSGKFNNIPTNAMMRVSFVGYQTLTLSPSSNAQIKLQPTATALQEVSVVATICDDEILKQLNARKGEKAVDANGKTFCNPTECVNDLYELRDGVCVDKYTEEELEDCTLAELEKLHASSGEKPIGGECVAMICATGYHFQEPEKVVCVKDDNDTALGATSDTTGTDAEQNSAPESAQSQNVKPTDNSKQIADAEKSYNDARERENSLENRMLGGATMAATGIGGMQLAQGLAEQNADKKTEQDMAAYLATFQCKVGDNGGRSYSGGEMGIEVAGTNQLTGLYQQYVDLAASLKERKNALGMAPGIESQVVMDKANMGLYDAEGGKGIENGTYASLYRASRGNETDANKLADQQNTSATRVKGGAIAAGVGAIGGAIGNAIINSGDDDDETVTEEDCKKVKGTYKDGKCTCPGKDKVYKKGKCVDKSDNNSGLAGLGASLGSSLGSSVNIGNVASMASGLMSGSGQ
ncbi:MAG: carboxypeptidase-like regulatory domain-containing protein [Alphaproteobacteria bacterium]|nr:carboxypeptidase-like regulatory domain-containing protein [Alphaproteobacteria bacterium]